MFSYMPPVVGGIVTHTYFLAKELVKRGHEVHVISFNSKNFGEKIHENIHVHGFGGCIDVNGLYSVGSKVDLPGVIAFLKKLKPDILHFHHKTSTIEFALHNLKEELNIPIVNTIHTQAGSLETFSFIDTVHYLHYNALADELKKASNGIIAVSKYNKDELVKRGISPEKIEVLANGVPLKDFDEWTKESARKKLNISMNEKIVLFVGRHSPEKGIDVLISAFKKLKKENTKLIIVGKGEFTPLYKFLAGDSKNIIFTGVLSQKEIRPYYKAADVFVLSSVCFEAQGLTLMEAMAAGVPVISTKTGGSEELVKKGNAGLIVKPRDHTALKDAMEKLLKDPALRKKFGINGYNLIKAEYSWDIITENVEKIYNNVLKKYQKK